MLYPNRRDVLVTLGALAAGAAIGGPVSYLYGMTASTTSQANTGEIDMPMITTEDGTQIFYKDWGPKDAQPIVFHHGWPLSSDDWDVQMFSPVSRSEFVCVPGTSRPVSEILPLRDGRNRRRGRSRA
jgi:non-heme chloroperoxidase